MKRRRPALLLLAALAAPATAGAPTARLVSCGPADCVLVRGERPSPAAAIEINGRRVEAAGGRRFAVRLPVATVRDWSAPGARSLRVAIDGDDESVRLPVGMLGGKIELAALVVRAR